MTLEKVADTLEEDCIARLMLLTIEAVPVAIAERVASSIFIELRTAVPVDEAEKDLDTSLKKLATAVDEAKKDLAISLTKLAVAVEAAFNDLGTCLSTEATAEEMADITTRYRPAPLLSPRAVVPVGVWPSIYLV